MLPPPPHTHTPYFLVHTKIASAQGWNAVSIILSEHVIRALKDDVLGSIYNIAIYCRKAFKLFAYPLCKVSLLFSVPQFSNKLGLSHLVSLFEVLQDSFIGIHKDLYVFGGGLMAIGIEFVEFKIKKGLGILGLRSEIVASNESMDATADVTDPN